jgi:hypothetical protein
VKDNESQTRQSKAVGGNGSERDDLKGLLIPVSRATALVSPASDSYDTPLRRFIATDLVSCASSIADLSISIMDGVTEDTSRVS